MSPAAPAPASAPAPEFFGFFLVPKFSMIAFTSAVEALRLANRMSGKTLYRWALYSADGKPQYTTTISGLAITSPPP